MAIAAQLVALAEAKQPWFWGSAGVIALVLLVLNLLLLVAVHARRLRQLVRGRRAQRFHASVEEVLAQLDPRSRTRDPEWLREQVARFNELEQPIAAAMLIERLRPASEAERKQARDVLREAGVIDVIVRSTKQWMPWRRALAIRTLGWIGAEETVPILLERLSDRDRYVRESTVRALGRIGDPRALPPLGELFKEPGPAAAGVVYDALIAFGAAALPTFADGLRSPVESVRVASCFGVAAVAEPEVVRSSLEHSLADEAAPVRAAAAEGLARVGGEAIPEALARASRDEHASVRRNAVSALGSYDDPHAVELVSGALADPDRLAAIRAAESLVRLSRRRAAGVAAAEALGRWHESWPVERALTLASIRAL